MALILTEGTSEAVQPNDDIFVCGASLLSLNIILTAAHCVLWVQLQVLSFRLQNDKLPINHSLFCTCRNRDHCALKVRVGDYDVSKQADEETLPYQETRVSTVKIHPHFNSKSLHNDLALLVTTEPFTLRSNVFPICSFLLDPKFTDANIYDRSACIATGWGKDAFCKFRSMVLYK